MAGLTFTDLPALSEAIEGYPPSVKLVALVLANQGEATQRQLVDETLLPARTVRDALAELQDAGVVETRPLIMDARQTLYSVTTDNSDDRSRRRRPLVAE
ncbi:MarR family transcriptional regulator [Halosegnis longus]|uniref:MarR family transcriptional regulator n=1 Tax=Halosegnis longus TaxID=2216012 RepID=A0AAJ4UVS3_9EURY|nr:helix-turn-helix domain-containing protein [Halosegnis longus]RNJ26303.1 MarR family transcriptional regulator [Salella cibi]